MLITTKKQCLRITHYALLITFLILAACQSTPTPTPTATLVPSLTATTIPTLQPTPTGDEYLTAAAVGAEASTATAVMRAATTLTPQAVPLEVQPLTGESIPPPLTISLPPGWESYYNAIPLSDVDRQIRQVRLAVYRGPVTGGRGFIVVLWGYPSFSLNPTAPAGGAVATVPGFTTESVIYADGLRLLRLAVIEQGCNIGTDLQRQYTIGGLPATGTLFSAVTCPELADTRGWFAGLQYNGLNFMFYVYTDPIQAMDTSQEGLQLILNSVQFLTLTAEQAAATATFAAFPTVPVMTPAP